MTNSIIIFHQFSPNGNRVGGIGKYILSLIKNLPKDIDISLIGVTNDKSKLFKWEKTLIQGRVVNFLAVCIVKDENKKKGVPTTLKYVFGLAASLRKVKYEGCLFMQRSEYVLPFIFSRKKKYLVIHNDITQQLNPKNSEVLWSKFPYVFKHFFGFMLRYFDHIFSVNNNSITFIRENYSTKLANKVSFSPTWADKDIFIRPEESLVSEERLSIAKKLNIPVDYTWLIFVGRFQNQKNINLLFDVLESLPRTVLLLAGDGDLKDSFIKDADNKGLADKSFFLGNVPHKMLPLYICSSDIFVSSSYFEGMSVALLESLQVGTPVVTTPTGESAVIIENEVNGIVTAGWDTPEFIKAIKVVQNFTHNVPLSCSHSVKKFSAEQTIHNILDKMAIGYNLGN